MNILTIQGSPRKQGKTSRVLDVFENEMISLGHKVERINLTDREINGCSECHACTLYTDRSGCIQNDEVDDIFLKMLDADQIVYASPLIGWNVSSLMKTFFDRHYSIVKGFHTPDHKSFIENIPVTFLITCMGPVENNTDIVDMFFDRFALYLKTGRVKKFVVPFSESPDYDERAEKTGTLMAREIAGE